MTDLVQELRQWAQLIGKEPRGARDLFNRAADEIERLTAHLADETHRPAEREHDRD